MFPLSWKSLAWSSPSLLQSTGSFENPSPFMLLLSGSWSHRVQGSCLPSVLQTSGRRKVRRRALSLKERSQKLPISFMVLFLCPRQSHDRSYLQGKLRGFPPVGLVRMPALPLNGCETLGKLLHLCAYFLVFKVEVSEAPEKWNLVTQSCPTLCNPVDYSPPSSSVHGIHQARILEWIAISFSKVKHLPCFI